VASGFLVLLLGAWGALVPFIGPHFGYAYTPDSTWTMTMGRLWLEVVPGAVAVLGGLILMVSASRAVGLWAGWLTALAGGWFAVGPIVSRLWTADGQPATGTPVGTGTVQTVVEQIGFFTGLGVVIVFLAATAIGRFSVVGIRETNAALANAEAETVADEDTTGDTTRLTPAADVAAEQPKRRGWLLRNDGSSRSEVNAGEKAERREEKAERRGLRLGRKNEEKAEANAAANSD
jgi:hypothetical protein